MGRSAVVRGPRSPRGSPARGGDVPPRRGAAVPVPLTLTDRDGLLAQLREAEEPVR
ncbi:hypothetical protein ACUN22_37010 [Streptomyces anulatus]|uniref:hypothetical protein n=1 Tax=Streptomyces anulatus TaxID=1892 RepID=UPI00403E287D